MQAEPQKEHKWLERLLGEWDYEHDCNMGPDQPPVKLTGKESVSSLGGLWFVCEGRGEMPGGGLARTTMTLGYDPVKNRYVGTFIGSMMTHMWVYDGEVDAAGKSLTLDTEGPSFTAPGKMARYKDVITFESDDHRTLTASFLGDDGQ